MKQLLVLLLALVTVVGWGQCDVTIVPGSIQVIDNDPGVQFQFDIINNGSVPYNGGTLYMAWTLSSNNPVWNFTLTTPLAPGENIEITTPSFDIPAVWDVGDYNLGVNSPSTTNPWLASQDWVFYTQPFPFQGNWAPFKLYLDDCPYEWIILPNSEFYYGPITDGCLNTNGDQFCTLDCDLGLNTFDPFGFEVEVFGDKCYNLTEYPFIPGVDVFVINFSFGGEGCGNVNYAGYPTMYEGDVQYFDFYTYGIGNIACADTVPTAFEENCKVQLGLSNNPNQVIGIDYNPSNNSVTIGTELDCELVMTAPDIGVDSLGYQLGGCNGEPLYWIPEINVTNYGDEVVTELCIEFNIWNVAGVDPDTLCFDNLNILPGQAYTFELPQNYNGGDDQLLITTTVLSSNGNPEPFNSNNTLNSTFLMYCYDCTNPRATNYNEFATNDDGSCIYDVFGCTDPAANNYNPDATIDDGSCTYTIPGCTDPNAYNYNPEANEDDGSCEYHVLGCTDEDALNYDNSATLDDGSCIYPAPYDPCDDVDIFAPNVFTPNNDGVNDAWYVVTDKECWKEWHVAVYNRWGSLVWESFNPDDKWNGSNNGSTHFVADGVYVYTIIANNWNSDATTLSGHITMFR